MLLAEIVETSAKVSATTKRLEKIDLLAALLKRLQPEEIEIAAAYLAGATRQGRIGIGYAAIRDAESTASETSTLQLLDLDRALEQFSHIQGAGSEHAKRQVLRDLFAHATRQEQHWISRLLLGEVRQGALEGIMFDALAKATGISGDRIRRAAMMGGGSATIARAALEQGEPGLAQFDVQLFRPVQPMLAQTAESISEALSELGDTALEYKFDGARLQAHKSGDTVALYSRGSNDITAAVPEVVASIRALPAHELILDGEVLSLTPEGRPQPFQVSMRRFGRKLDVDPLLDELPMTPFWFDVLYLNGGSMIDEPQSKRFEELTRLVRRENVVPHLTTTDPEAAEKFLEQALRQGHEGVMAKSRAAGYAAGARGQSWLKIKQARTLDLVILAAEWGSGRRQGWLSNLHLGARDTIKGGFAMLGKTFKGLTDEMLAWQTQEFLKLETGRDRHTVYVRPALVAEIAFNEIQVSPRYVSGLALRFARVKRYRTDKSAADADTFQTVQRMAG
ncbi:MAG: ATP-dependent DNA ligase, partial [Deltaproteobacteria bacterium]|nr:ATP-dependent DNA ligase [Deltaproteobacteria bacterium]